MVSLPLSFTDRTSMKISPLLLIVASVSLASCTTTLPIVGQMERSPETFDGSVTGSGYSGGSGELTLVSSGRSTCRGNFTYTSRRRGEGVLRCDDGRSGPFHVSGAGSSGSGYGDLSGQRFTFTFGPRA